VIQGFAGLISAAFILRFFSPAVQGYYYTFGNVLALQIFLELGLSAVINTFAAHEWAKLSLDQKGVIQGDSHALSRLRALTYKVGKWYLFGGVLLLIFLIFAGSWFFATRGDTSAVSWKYPWLAMCLLAFVGFIVTPAWALLTGCGQLATLNGYKLIDIVVRCGVLWTCMALGASLWSAVAAIAVSTTAGCIFLYVRYRRFFSSLLGWDAQGNFHWLKELAPLQFRIAVSWVCGYFIFSLSTPAMFHFHGAEDAGRMGMTWALIAGLSGIAGTWLQVQAPEFAMMIARKQYAMLDSVAWRTALIGVSVFVLGSGVALGGLYLLDAYRPDIAGRFIPLGSIAVFLLAECMLQLSSVQATYLRAFKQEPFLPLSVMGALVIGAGILWLTPGWGAYGPAVSYLIGMTIGLIWGTFIFLRYRKKWTSPA
jgi:hypothetical protein